jgi:hypothetical protein
MLTMFFDEYAQCGVTNGTWLKLGEFGITRDIKFVETST